MAVLLDYHIEMALHKGWKTYTTNAAAFAELFPGVDATTLTAWRTAVVVKPPAIVPAFKRGTDTFPLIWVHAESEAVDEQPLGNMVDRDDQGRMRDQVLSTQTAIVSIFAPTPIMLRCWYGIVRAVLLTQVPHLNRYYLDMRFMSADDMSTDEESIGEQFGLAGVTVRHLRITAKCQETFTHWDSTQPNVPWYVLAEDQQTVDGQPGGVVPSDV